MHGDLFEAEVLLELHEDGSRGSGLGEFSVELFLFEEPCVLQGHVEDFFLVT